MKRLLAEFICMFVPKHHSRKRIRVEMNNPIRKWTAFAKSFSNSRHPHVKRTYGHRFGNFVVNIDDKFVFKFPIKSNGWDVAEREKRITDALRPISPIKIPKMEILDFNGIAVRKYECINGIGFHHLTRDVQNAHTEKIAKQLAKFLYIVGKSDPVAIRDLKNKKTDRPSVMHGWSQNDLWDNFILNPKTFDVVAAIDWEDAIFGDFYRCFTSDTGNDNMKIALLREYLKLYTK